MTCICKQYDLYKSGSHTFESQSAAYTCGPIAIINALHYEGKPTGPAVHRQIMVACRPKPKHADGFKGTKPADMDRVIRSWWPAATSVHGSIDCLKAIKRSKAAILLYQRTPRNQHYIFIHRDAATYHLENEGDSVSVTETEMDDYMTSTAVVWTLY